MKSHFTFLARKQQIQRYTAQSGETAQQVARQLQLEVRLEAVLRTAITPIDHPKVHMVTVRLLHLARRLPIWHAGKLNFSRINF